MHAAIRHFSDGLDGLFADPDKARGPGHMKAVIIAYRSFFQVNYT